MVQNSGALPDFHDEVHVDESWFFLLDGNLWQRYYPGEKREAPRTVFSRVYLDKVTFFSANARPRPEYGFDGKIDLRRCASIATRQRSKKASTRSGAYKGGDEYIKDESVNATFYLKLMSDLVKVIRQKMWWFQEGARYVVKEENGRRCV